MVLLIASFIAFFGMGLIISYAIWLSGTINIAERFFYGWIISLVVFPVSILVATSIFSHNILISILSSYIVVLIVSGGIVYYRSSLHSDTPQL